MYVSPVDGHVAGTTSVQSPERMSATYAAYASALVATTDDDDDDDDDDDVLVASRSRNAPYVAVAASAGMVFARGAMPTMSTASRAPAHRDADASIAHGD